MAKTRKPTFNTIEDYLKAHLSRSETRAQEPKEKDRLSDRLAILLEGPVETPLTALFILSTEQLEALLQAATQDPPSLTAEQRTLFKASKVLPRVQPSWGYVVSPARLGQLVHPPNASFPLLT